MAWTVYYACWAAAHLHACYHVCPTSATILSGLCNKCAKFPKMEVSATSGLLVLLFAVSQTRSYPSMCATLDVQSQGAPLRFCDLQHSAALTISPPCSYTGKNVATCIHNHKLNYVATSIIFSAQISG